MRTGREGKAANRQEKRASQPARTHADYMKTKTQLGMLWVQMISSTSDLLHLPYYGSFEREEDGQ